MKGTGRGIFMTFRNMAVVRVCFIFVLILCVDRIAGKPFLEAIVCEWFYDCDDIDASSTTTSASDYDDWGCEDYCRPRRPRTTTVAPATMAPGGSQNGGPPRIVFGGENGPAMSMSVGTDGNWYMQVVTSMTGSATPAPATTAAAAPSTTAAAAGASAATTAAPAASTTAAG